MVQTAKKHVWRLTLDSWAVEALLTQHVLGNAGSICTATNAASLLVSQTRVASARPHIIPSVETRGLGPELLALLNVMSLMILQGAGPARCRLILDRSWDDRRSKS